MVHALLVRLRVPLFRISEACIAMYTEHYDTSPAGSSPRLLLILDHKTGLKSIKDMLGLLREERGCSLKQLEN